MVETVPLIWKFMCQSRYCIGNYILPLQQREASSCCAAQDCVLDHVPRLTHAFVMRCSGEQVPAVSNAHGDDQLIHVGLLNARLPRACIGTRVRAYMRAHTSLSRHEGFQLRSFMRGRFRNFFAVYLLSEFS